VTDRSLVQRSPTECDVSEGNREISTMKRRRPTGAVEPWKGGGGGTIIYLLSSREVISYHSRLFYFFHFLNIGTFRTLISSPMFTTACRDEIKCTVLWGGNVKMCSTNPIVQPASVLALSGERASVWPTYMFRGFVTRNKNFKIKVFWHVTPCGLFVQGRRAP
jgi:hypothetical protein